MQVTLIVCLALAASVRAEEQPLDERIAAAAKDGPEALEALLGAVVEAEREPVRRALGAQLVALGDPYRALAQLEPLARDGELEDRLAYADALIAVAQGNLQSGNTTAAGVVPYLIDARRALEGIAPEDPSDRARVALARASAWFYEGRLDEAAEALADVAAFPEDRAPTGYALLAQIHYRKGRYAPAAEAFEKAGQTEGAAAAWSAAEEGGKSAKLYAQLLAERPDDLALLGRAVAAARFAGGIDLLDAALAEIETEGTVRAAHLIARADLARIAGRAADADPWLEEAAALDPSSSAALIRLARRVLTDTGMPALERRRRAAALLLRALERTPEDSQVVSGLWHIAGRDYGDLWKTAGTGQTAERSVQLQRALVEATPDDATAWANLGNTLRVVGRTEEALAAYARAREENEWDPSLLSDQGLALSASGAKAEALKAFLGSVEIDAGHISGRQNAARELWRAGRDAEAGVQLAAAVRKARAVDRKPMTYRFLLDRTWRTRQDETLR